MPKYTSLVDIWSSRPDLQQAFPKGTTAGTPDNQKLNNWWNQYGVKEYPNIVLVQPGDNRIQNPQTLTAEAQQQTTPITPTTPTTPIAPTTPTIPTQKPYIRNPNSNDVYDRQGNWIDSTKASQIPDFWNQVEITESAPLTNKWQDEIPEYDTGNEDLNTILKSIGDVLTSITNSGKIVNPNIDITPELVKQWTDQASQELDPYYKSQFDAIKNDLSTDLTYLSDQYNQTMKSQETQFKQTLAAQREAEAGAGTIFSGERLTREQELAQSAQRNMESLGTTAGYQAGKTGTTAERTIGSGGLTGLTSPTYKGYGISTLGEGQYIPLSDRTLFSPTGNITGSLEREQIEKKRAYSDLLKSYWLAEQNV